MNKGADDDTPIILNTSGKRALYNNLGNDINLAVAVHNSIFESRKADWRGNLQKERHIKAALYKHLQNEENVETIFNIIKEQHEY